MANRPIWKSILTSDRLNKRVRQFFWAIPVALYTMTMARTVGYIDAALILHNAYNPNISAWVNNHNLFSLMGWLWIRILPFGNEFFRINLLSALFGAGTVYLVFLTCYEYTKRISISLITATALMLSHSLWWHSTMLEVYTLNTVLISLILFSVLKYLRTGNKKWFFAAFLFWGLGISNHILMGLFVFAFLALLIIERRNYTVSDLILAAVFLLIGLSVFIFAFVKTYIGYRSLARVVDMITGGEFRSYMFSSRSRPSWWLNFIFLLLYQYPSLILVFLFVGVYALVSKPRRFDLFLVVALLPQMIWSANYYVWDMYAFSLPVYVLSAILICKGLTLRRYSRTVLIIVSISLLIPIFLYKNVHRINLVRRYVYRYPLVEVVKDSMDPVKYFLDPDKHGFDLVDSYVQEVFRRLPGDSWFFGNPYDVPINYYYQDIRHERTDLHCPILFSFAIPEHEQAEAAARISNLAAREDGVFVSKFIFTLLQTKLVYRKIETIKIHDQEIYRLY